MAGVTLIRPGSGIAVDSSGNAYLTGYTGSPDFPRVNQISGACNGTCGVFITKINAAGNALVYSSVIGGSHLDHSSGIAVDSSGDAYLTGSTQSPDFPVVNQIPGACNGTCSSGLLPEQSVVFVTKINAAGSALVYSSLIGGSGIASASGIDVDASGNAYVTGSAGSPDFPRVNQISGACNGTCGNGATPAAVAFVTKINAAGSALLYSSLLGGSGSGSESSGIYNAIAVDTSGNVYVTGLAGSPDFPIVNQIPGACNGTCGSGAETNDFVTKINAAGNALVYSSFIGGSGGDLPSGIAVDSSGDAYLTGSTYSPDFPIVNQIPGACNGTCGSGATAVAFVTKINVAGNALVYSSLIGGTDSEPSGDSGFGIAVDGSGNVYLTGSTYSPNFPVVNQIPGACNGTCGSGANFGEAFVAKIVPFVQGRAVLLSPQNLSINGYIGVPSSPQPVLLTNTGTVTVSISLISITPANGVFTQTNNCGNAIAAGSNCTIEVTFTPTAVGAASATLTVEDDASNSPQTAGLTGTGAALSGGTPVGIPSPSNLYFGAAVVGGSSGALTVTLTNGGNAPLTLSANPTVAAPFALAATGNTCTSGASLSPGSSCEVSVTLNPIAAGQTSGTLTFTDNASPPTQPVALSGAGLLPFHEYDLDPPVPQTLFDYDEPTSPGCKTHLYGCALTSTASLLTTFDGTVTPVSLDASLIADTKDPGYVQYTDLTPPDYCNFNWSAVPTVELQNSSNAINLQLLPSKAETNLTINDYLVTHLIQDKQMVVLQLHYQASDGNAGPHYITVLGPTDSTLSDWYVMDPGWPPSAVTCAPGFPSCLSTLSGHLKNPVFSVALAQGPVNFTFQVLGVRTYASAGTSRLVAGANSPVELLITDPEGRRLGNLPDGSDIFEIPLGSYFREFPIADDTGTGPGLGDPSGSKTAYVPTPMDGVYTVTATGTASGSYTLWFDGVATDGTAQTTTVTGTTTKGAFATYQVSYASAPGSPLTVTKVPTGPQATLSTSSLTFAGQIVNATSAPQNVTLSNPGDSTLTITSISVDGDFAQTNNCGASVAAGAGCTINVTLTPTAGSSRSGTLTIADNAAGTPQAVALSGTGEDFSVAVQSGTASTATVTAGQGATYKLTLAPQGGFKQPVSFTCSGAPAGATCSASPASVTLDGTNAATVTVTVTTTARSVTLPRSVPPPAMWGTPARLRPLILLCILCIVVFVVRLAPGRRAASRRPWVIASALLACLIFAGLLASCGGGGSGPAPGPAGTPPGTYTLTVAGTSGSLTQNANLTLTVN